MDYQTIPVQAASEVLSCEDLSRINEVAPKLLRELAAVAGKSIGELRQLAADGALTSGVLLGLSRH